MALRTKAAVLTGPRQIDIRELAVPEVRPDNAVLRVEVTGVCGVDWPAYTQSRADRFEVPIILGHEIVGRIEQIGVDAAKKWGVKEGDRVAMEEYAPCGRCSYCSSGHYYLCGGMRMPIMYGFTSMSVAPGLWGGFSQFVYLDPNSRLHKLADSVPTRIAPLYIPISNGIRWVQREGGIGIDDTIVILGPGQLGLASVVAAKEAGAGCIIITGRKTDANRLAVARKLGAHHVINVDAEDPVERVAAITNGRMADAVINVAAGAPRIAQQAMELCKIRGTIVMAGGAGRPAEDFHSDLLSRKELTMKGVRGRAEVDLKKAIRLVESNRHSLDLLATHKFSIDETDLALRSIGGEGVANPIHISVVPEAV
jgi:2-desacetyl-2-hydroxyethyl bacteriochlorophyllide A dehydrogenase